MGLILAIDNYDPDRGYKFLSFAVWYIRREILKEIYNTGCFSSGFSARSICDKELCRQKAWFCQVAQL